MNSAQTNVSAPAFKRRTRRKAVQIDTGAVMKMTPLREGIKMPLVIEPNHEQVDLIYWLQNNKEEWYKLWLDHGAVLFRGFGVDTIEKVDAFAGCTIDEVFKENTEHQPVSDSGSVQVPVEYAKDSHLLWHNENTFNLHWPTRAIFACGIPAETGGETPLVDARVMYDAIDPEIVDMFATKGVMYVRSYGVNDYVGLSWKKVFNTEDKKVVEAKCIEQKMEFEWLDNDTLITRSRRPGVLQHPETGHWCWINQAQHWHFSCLTKQTQEAISKLYKEAEYPRNCYFGDGSRIDDEVMAHILQKYREHEVVFPWQQGDVALVDNRSVAHARNPYTGERKIFVCFGDMSEFTTQI